MILILAWTAKAFLAGKKTQTRRLWNRGYFDTWRNQYLKFPDRVHQAYDSSPRSGGEKIGELRLVKKPKLELVHDISEADFIAEGGYEKWENRAEFIRLFVENSDADLSRVPLAVLYFERVGKQSVMM